MNLFSSTLMVGVFAVLGLSDAANATVTTMVTQSTSAPTDGLMSTQMGVTTLTFDSDDVGSQPPGFTPPTGTIPGGGVVGGGGNAGLYAAPNGDMSQFYAVALNPVLSPTVPSSDTLNLGSTCNYFGFYWGSIDIYNTLQFYKDSTLVASFTGADFPAADGNQMMSQLAAKFTQASQTGDLSALQPPNGGHGHHHHHGGGGGSAASATTQASAYDQSSDPMSQIESVISNALSSAS